MFNDNLNEIWIGGDFKKINRGDHYKYFQTQVIEKMSQQIFLVLTLKLHLSAGSHIWWLDV